MKKLTKKQNRNILIGILVVVGFLALNTELNLLGVIVPGVPDCHEQYVGVYTKMCATFSFDTYYFTDGDYVVISCESPDTVLYLGAETNECDATGCSGQLVSNPYTLNLQPSDSGKEFSFVCYTNDGDYYNRMGRVLWNLQYIPSCQENWVCGDWTTCRMGMQARTCVDENNCGTTDDKPETQRTCTCVEDWSCTEWSSCVGNTQTRTCTDANTCGTTNNKPDESKSCDVNCIEEWTCTEWGDCVDGLQGRLCSDDNNCGTTNNKPSESQPCGQPPINNYLIILAVVLIMGGLTYLLVRFRK